eukprot:COSAG02_NODE_5061_length_4680_cov_18.604938_1_plen_67_part_10
MVPYGIPVVRDSHSFDWSPDAEQLCLGLAREFVWATLGRLGTFNLNSQIPAGSWVLILEPSSARDL